LSDLAALAMVATRLPAAKKTAPRIAGFCRWLVSNSREFKQASTEAPGWQRQRGKYRALRAQVIAAAIALTLLQAAPVRAEQRVDFDIPPLSAANALSLFAQQADVALLYPYFAAKAVNVAGLKGRYTVDEGLRQLLHDTCLSAVGSDSSGTLASDNNETKGIAIVRNNSCNKASTTKTLTVAILSALGIGQGYAQEANTNTGQAKPKSALMEEVVVTARKRAVGEAVQDTPIAMTAFGTEQFKAVFADNLDDLGKLSPGVELKPSAQVGAQNFTIRGMGVSGTTPSDESAVGIFQDGVFWGVNYGAMLDTFDVESVQILRGPQGTLFGRNVTGGAVVVRTARPTGDFGYELEGVVGDYGRRDISGSVQGPLIQDKLAAKLAVLDRRLDGYYTNKFDGKDFGESHTTVIRPTFKLDITENLDATLILEQYKQRGDSIAATAVSWAGGKRNMINKAYDLNIDSPGDSKIDEKSAVLEVNWNILQGVVTSISGYREVDVDNNTDFDGRPTNLFNQIIDYSQDQFSEELRYASKFSEFWDFTAGLYYFTQNFDFKEGRDLSNHATITATGAHLDQSSYAVFGESDIHLTDQLTLTVGGRYTSETKEGQSVAFQSVATRCPGVSVYNLSSCDFDLGRKDDETWKDFSPKVGITFKPSPDHLIYGSVTRGFRSGGFSMRGNALLSPFDAEKVTAYEGGYKGALFDQRLRLNASIYRNDYSDLQRTVLGPDPVFGVVQSTFNAADATIKGLEIDVALQATDNLVLTAGYGYTDASYGSKKPGVTFNTDNDFARVPQESYSGAATYDLALGDIGNLQFRVSATYTGDQYFDDANLFHEGSYTLVDSSVTYSDVDKHWNVSLFGKNLGDKEYAYWGSSAGGGNAFLGAPRTYGLRVNYKY
jgi:iron complex outermembrane receptor protein